MKWGSTAASGSSFRALQPSTSFKAGSRTEATPTFFLNAPCGAGCLPTLRAGPRRKPGFRSQCTPSGAGCLPTSPTPTPDPSPKRLNTPCGAGCLSTRGPQMRERHAHVSIHRVVLGAYRHAADGLGLSCPDTSQYTVWCWVLIDARSCKGLRPSTSVSIHRVVLGAYRRVL